MATEVTPIRPIEPLPEFAGILQEREVFATGQDDHMSNRVNGWFDRLMVQSGIEMAPSTILSLALLSAVAFGGTVFVLKENFLGAAAVFVAGFILPIGIVMMIRTRRQTQMMKQMPTMLEELARAAKTGRSLEHCFLMAAEETLNPLGAELQRGARRVQMGVDFATALRELPARTGLISVNILVTALSVHQQMGGDLVTVLVRLSQTIRDRLMFLGRLRAATIASRWTAVLMISLPPAILAFFVFRDPSYFQNLMSSSWGRLATVVAALLEIIGTVFILVILKNSQRA